MLKISMAVAAFFGCFALLFGSTLTTAMAQTAAKTAETWVSDNFLDDGRKFAVIETLLKENDDVEQQTFLVAEAKLRSSEQDAALRRKRDEATDLAKKTEKMVQDMRRQPDATHFTYADGNGVMRNYTRPEVESDLEKKLVLLKDLQQQIKEMQEISSILTKNYTTGLASLRSLDAEMARARRRVFQVQNTQNLINEKKRAQGFAAVSPQAKNLAEANKILDEFDRRQTREQAAIEVRDQLGKAEDHGIDPLAMTTPISLLERADEILGVKPAPAPVQVAPAVPAAPAPAPAVIDCR